MTPPRAVAERVKRVAVNRRDDEILLAFKTGDAIFVRDLRALCDAVLAGEGEPTPITTKAERAALRAFADFGSTRGNHSEDGKCAGPLTPHVNAMLGLVARVEQFPKMRDATIFGAIIKQRGAQWAREWLDQYVPATPATTEET